MLWPVELMIFCTNRLIVWICHCCASVCSVMMVFTANQCLIFCILYECVRCCATRTIFYDHVFVLNFIFILTVATVMVNDDMILLHVITLKIYSGKLCCTTDRRSCVSWLDVKRACLISWPFSTLLVCRDCIDVFCVMLVDLNSHVIEYWHCVWTHPSVHNFIITLWLMCVFVNITLGLTFGIRNKGIVVFFTLWCIVFVVHYYSLFCLIANVSVVCILSCILYFKKNFFRHLLVPWYTLV